MKRVLINHVIYPRLISHRKMWTFASSDIGLTNSMQKKTTTEQIENELIMNSRRSIVTETLDVRFYKSTHRRKKVSQSCPKILSYRLVSFSSENNNTKLASTGNKSFADFFHKK